jgi:hypothetical protein
MPNEWPTYRITCGLQSGIVPPADLAEARVAGIDGRCKAALWRCFAGRDDECRAGVTGRARKPDANCGLSGIRVAADGKITIGAATRRNTIADDSRLAARVSACAGRDANRRHRRAQLWALSGRYRPPIGLDFPPALFAVDAMIEIASSRSGAAFRSASFHRLVHDSPAVWRNRCLAWITSRPGIGLSQARPYGR